MTRVFPQFCVRLFCAFVAIAASALPVHAQGSTCALWVTKIVDAAQDPAFRNAAQDWARRFGTTQDPVLARGMLKLLVEKDTKTVLEYFAALSPAANPFGDTDAVYRAFGRFTTDAYDDATPGIQSVIGNLVAETASNEKGALGELFIANRLLDEGQSVLGFQQVVGVGGASRRYDVVTADFAAANQGLPGLVREVKNWATPLTGVADSRLRDLADEFRRDIAIHENSGFAFLRIDLRSSVSGQVSMIRDRLAAEIDSVFPTDPVRAAAVRANFLAEWNSGRIVSLF